MGARSALQLERGYAGGLTDAGPGGSSGIHVCHPKLVSGRRIEISVEHAVTVAELKLEAGPFLDLQRGPAEVLNDLVDGQARELSGGPRRRRDLDRLLNDLVDGQARQLSGGPRRRRDLDRLLNDRRRSLGPRGAAGEEKGGSEC